MLIHQTYFQLGQRIYRTTHGKKKCHKPAESIIFPPWFFFLSYVDLKVERSHFSNGWLNQKGRKTIHLDIILKSIESFSGKKKREKSWDGREKKNDGALLLSFYRVEWEEREEEEENASEIKGENKAGQRVDADAKERAEREGLHSRSIKQEMGGQYRETHTKWLFPKRQDNLSTGVTQHNTAGEMIQSSQLIFFLFVEPTWNAPTKSPRR